MVQSQLLCVSLVAFHLLQMFVKKQESVHHVLDGFDSLLLLVVFFKMSSSKSAFEFNRELHEVSIQNTSFALFLNHFFLHL